MDSESSRNISVVRQPSHILKVSMHVEESRVYQRIVR